MKTENVVYKFGIFPLICLSQECPSGSLDSFNLPTLILTAGKSSQCFFEARNAFNRTYGVTHFYIDGTTGGILDYNKQSVRIQNFNATQSVLNLFGDLIQFINISFIDINQVNGNVIVTSIAAKCTTSLRELHLMDCHDMVLNGLTQSFPSVKQASFSTRPNGNFQIEPDALRMNEMFPNLTRLVVQVNNIMDMDFVGEKFPWLRSLTLVLPESEYFAFNSIERLFQNSPSINKLILHHSSLELLQIVSENLNNLKVLELIDFSNDFYAGQPIEFKHVNSLAISSTHSNSKIPETLVFYQLQTFSLRLSFRFTDQWLQIFSNQLNKSIEFVEIESYRFTLNQFSSIAKMLPNVRIASIRSEKKVPINVIIEFLRENQRILIFDLKTALINVAEREWIEENLQCDWDINYDYPSINRIGLTFTR